MPKILDCAGPINLYATVLTFIICISNQNFKLLRTVYFKQILTADLMVSNEPIIHDKQTSPVGLCPAAWTFLVSRENKN